MSEFHAEPQHADIVIIGAGILGATIALSAARRGFSVIVIDQNTTVGFGSTSSSAGIIRVHAGDIESSLIANESVSAWKTWRDFAEVPFNDPAAEFIQCGTFILEDFNGTLDRVANVMDQARVQYSELDSAALQQAVPWIDIGKYGPPTQPDTEEFWEDREEVIERAIHTPSSGYVADPALAAQNLADLASRLGASFMLGTKVVQATEGANDRIILTTSSGVQIESPIVVNAAGPGSINVNDILGVGGDFVVKQRLIRQELHHVTMAEPQPNLVHIVDGDIGINFRPEGADGFLVGSSGDPVDGEEVIDSPDNFRVQPTREGWYRQAGRASRRIPSLKLTAIPRGVAGLYDVTDDWLPIFDKTDRPGVFVAIGTSGNQFKTAPVVGELMMHIIEASTNGTTEHESTLEMVLPATASKIPLATFSRLRTPRLNGSRG